MCLAVPMKVIEIREDMGDVEVGGVKREVGLMLLDDVRVGDWVIIHAGFAISKLDETQAEETLDLLKEKGLVIETDLGGGRFLYHPAGKAQHHHLVCRKCGSVTDIDASMFHRLRDELTARYGFDAEFEHIAIFGTCAKCRQ